jgi:hypothetical protein
MPQGYDACKQMYLLLCGLEGSLLWKRTSLLQARHSFMMRRRTLKHAKWVKSGAVNVNHMAVSLENEIAAATSSSTVPALFQKAIDSATAVNYVQDQALANERAAVNCLFESNTVSATEFMVEASRMYKRWVRAPRLPKSIPSIRICSSIHWSKPCADMLLFLRGPQ